LLDSGLDHDSVQAKTLLVRWGKLHAVRTLASVTATTLFLIATLRL